jgi:hypothetical protein
MFYANVCTIHRIFQVWLQVRVLCQRGARSLGLLVWRDVSLLS